MIIGQRVLARSPEHELKEYLVMIVHSDCLTLVDENNNQIQRFYWEVVKVKNED